MASSVRSHSDTSDATRYLCAAMHIDTPLAERAVREILDDKYRARAPCHGVDADVVLRHALAARRRHRVRDAILAALLLLMLMSLSNFVMLSLVVFLALSTVAIEDLVTRYGVLARDLGRVNYHPERVEPPKDPRLIERLAEIKTHRDGNVTIYSGYAPFIGSGISLGAWSFAVDASKPAKDEANPHLVPREFTVDELHRHVTSELLRLEWNEVTVEDRVFVNGLDLRNDNRFLPHPYARPKSQVDPALVNVLLANPADTARAYTVVYVTGWRGQLELSMHLRYMLLNRSLFVEASYSLLTPFKEQYYEVDNLLPRPTFRQLLKIGAEAAVIVVPRLVLSVPRTVGTTFAPLRRHMRNKAAYRVIGEGLPFDYGAPASLREAAADPHYRRYFQQLDKEMYTKVIEKRVFDAIVSFLDNHGVDTSELVDRTKTILNHGVFITGGSTVTAGSMAAGPGASATNRMGGRADGQPTTGGQRTVALTRNRG